MAELLVNIDAMKTHLRVEHHDEDLLIEDLIRAATEFMERSTSLSFTTADEAPELYLVAIKLTVGSWYINREASTPTQLRSIPLGVDRIINLLRPGSYYLPEVAP